MPIISAAPPRRCTVGLRIINESLRVCVKFLVLARGLKFLGISVLTSQGLSAHGFRLRSLNCAETLACEDDVLEERKFIRAILS